MTSARAQRQPTLDELRKHQVLQLQRQYQQGLGRHIVSGTLRDQRFVAVGTRGFIGSYKTFPDFLLEYIKSVLGVEWGAAEQAKGALEWHPIFTWLEHVRELRRRHAAAPGEVYSTELTGAVAAYLGLAYDLYTLEHNAEQAADRALQAKLIARLKHRDQFVGARHEIRVAAILLRAGFTLEWEDEQDRRRTHCEFTATYPPTGARFGVETKIRQPVAAGANRQRGRFGRLLVDGLKKDTPHRRIVFIDLNTPALDPNGRADWRRWAVGQTRMIERDTALAALPPAYVVISSYPYHHHLDQPAVFVDVLVEGFKIPGFQYDATATLREAISLRRQHVEMEALIASMAEHTEIPSTFDGEVHELPVDDRVLLGGRFPLGDGRVGIVTDASVDEKERQAIVLVTLETAEVAWFKKKLSDEEMALWRAKPEALFGSRQHRRRRGDPLLRLYDFFLESYRNTPRDRLLELMAAWPNYNDLLGKPQAELADLISEATAESAARMNSSDRPIQSR